MLVGCQLVNKAGWRVAEGVHAEVRRLWPTPVALSAADPVRLGNVLRPLGFGSRRAPMLVAFAAAWHVAEPRTAEDVEGMPGCGRYAADTWRIFVEGRRDVEVTDGRLEWFLRRERGEA